MRQTDETPRKPLRDRARERGLALLIVLWTLVVLTLLAGSVQRVGNTDLELAASIRDITRSTLLAEGAAEWAAFGLAGSTPANAYWRPDSTVYGWREGDIEIRVRITDESGRVDLNGAPEPLLRRLMIALGADRETAKSLSAAIADFRDSDDITRPFGAEDQDYDLVSHPLGSKDAAFETLVELTRVKGMTHGWYRALLPMVTIHSGRSHPIWDGAHPLIRGLAEEGEPQRLTTSPYVPSGEVGLGDMPQVLHVPDQSIASWSGLYRIEVETRDPGGYVGGRVSVVLLTGRRDRPYRLLAEWDEPLGLFGDGS